MRQLTTARLVYQILFGTLRGHGMGLKTGFSEQAQ